MRKKRFLAILLMLTMLFSCFGSSTVVKAGVPFIIKTDSVNVYDVVPGKTTHFAIPVRLGHYNYTITYSTTILVEVTTESGLFSTTAAYITAAGDNVKPSHALSLSSVDDRYVEFDLDINDTAKIGTYEANLKFTFQGYDFNGMDAVEVNEASVPINLRVTKELAPAQITVDNFKYKEAEATIGGNFELEFDVINGGEIKAYNTFVNIDYGNSGIIPDYTLESVKAGDIAPGKSSKQTFPVRVLQGTEPGLKTLTICFTYKDIAGAEYQSSRTVYVNLLASNPEPDEDAKLVAEAAVLNEEIYIDSDYNLKLELENVGVKTAKNITAFISENGGIGAATGILPKYPLEGVEANNIAAGKKATVELPLLITSAATEGLQELNVQVDYEDAKGRKLSTYAKVYITVKRPKTAEEVINDLVIGSVTQSPESPIAGEVLTVKFTISNNGNKDVKDVAIYAEELSNSGFEPLTAEIKQQIGDLAQGASQEVTMKFRLGNQIPEGMNQLQLAVSYEDANKAVQKETTTLYILNVQPKSEEQLINSVSISEISQFPEQPVAGNILTLTFQVKNSGNKDISDLVLYGEDLSGSGFEPLTADVNHQVGDLKQGASKEVTMKFRVGSQIPEGMNQLKLAASYVDANGDSQKEMTTIYVLNVQQVSVEQVKNSISISEVSQSPEQPVAGDTLTLTFQVENDGNKDVTDLVLYGEDFSSSGFEPLTADVKHYVGNLAQGTAQKITMKFKVGSQIPEGMNQLKLAASYVDANGAAQKEDTTIYILNVKQVSVEQVKNSISISEITQTPESPVVGENVTVSFKVTNHGTKGITNLKFKGAGLGSTNFEPISSEIYTLVGDIEANKSKKVSMTFKVGADIPEGFNTLSLEYTYVDGNGDVQTENTSFYVLNVKNASSVNTSKPKLIVSTFSTSTEELRAGSTFDFTFGLKNTHTAKAAKNIKVTVLQQEGIFTPTSGSNSFYIDEIAPGEECTNTLNMKVRSDTATGTYEISIKVEYEYDDMSQVDASAGGVSDENVIRLQAVENARPAAQNMMIGYGWDTPIVNQSTTLSFDFYNMGKSTLDNVYVTLSGDFMMESGTMQIIGSVMAGSSSYQEISIIPTMEGMCSGILTVHFEDSNGDEVTKEFEIPETYVQGDYSMGGDFYMPDYGWDEPVDSGDVVTPKEPLMPVWAYVTALVAALLVGMLVTRAIVIKRHKAKLWKEEEI